MVQGFPELQRVHQGIAVDVIPILFCQVFSFKCKGCNLFSPEVYALKIPPIHMKNAPLKMSVVSKLVFNKITSFHCVLYFLERYDRKQKRLQRVYPFCDLFFGGHQLLNFGELELMAFFYQKIPH